jgi:FkbM family methyltransferase
VTFISYAQNFEDVLLNRALAGVEGGIYVDIGAGDPEIDSVTKAFYDRGWSGINVEPLSRFHTRLAEQRARDVNLRAVVSDASGSIPFFEVDGYEELSTTLPDIAAGYRESGRAVTEHVIGSVTLASLLENNAAETIHFLKVDVEGAEFAVLRGADFSRFRPWIIVVESVAFGESSSDEDAWVELLVAADYVPVYFDGLNRYFVAREKEAELAGAFGVPVNVRDNFSRPRESRAEITLERLAAILGLESYSDEHEVLERTETLLAHRIGFELRLQEVGAELDGLKSLAASLETQRAALQIEVDAFEQQSFERERYIASLTIEVERMRIASHEIEKRVDEANDRVAGSQAQIADILGSTSWKASLPLRVLRRPLHYLRVKSAR